MKHLILGCLVALAAVWSLHAQELVTLTAPVSYTNTSAYHLSTLVLDVDNMTITATLTATAPATPIVKQYGPTTTPTGATLLHNINTGNFSTNSLIKAVYNRLITDGVISGTVNGVPQH